jgi:hypothetical protein
VSGGFQFILARRDDLNNYRGRIIDKDVQLIPSETVETQAARWFWPVLVAVLIYLGVVQVLSVRQESMTWDEGIEISSGYVFLKTGQNLLEPDHPPLARLLPALPLLWMNPAIDVSHPSFRNNERIGFGTWFMYHNRVDAGRMLFAARLTVIATTLLLVLAAGLWVRSMFGAVAGLACAWLLAFDPTVIAHGRYAKQEMLVSLFAVLAMAAWGRYLSTWKWRWAAFTGTLFGLALMSKFTAFFLVPVFIVTYALAHWWRARRFSPLRCLLVLVTLVLFAAPVAVVTYAPEVAKLAPATRRYRAAHPSARRLVDVKWVTSEPAGTVVRTSHRLGLQDHSLLVGLVSFLDHNSVGHRGYLLGKLSETGWWYYFPVAFAVKTPLATLVALALAAALAARRLWISRRRLRSAIRFEVLLCAIPVAVYVLSSMASRVDIGLRLLLPVYPFLFALAAAPLAGCRWRWRGAAGAALGLLLAVESLSIYPHYTAFFNVAVGGPGAGPRYLLDSNLDWGQDLPELHKYLAARGNPKLCLCFFSTADTAYYGIESYESVPRTWDFKEREEVDCLAAVSATPLYNLYMQPREMTWLQGRTPVAKIGYSIYVFDLRRGVTSAGASPRD